MTARSYAGTAPRARRRPAPRRRVRRRVGPTRVHWDRIGRVVLVIVLFCVMASYLNPVVNLVGAWRDSQASSAKLRDLRLEHQKLQNQVEDASNPVVLEREARRLGRARPGERVYVVRGLSN